ncbi:unnamed protein product [Medioppia subpectinata]|uniref:Cytochrome P450 n=1 Tax=Medioppia subpectinata TaxID=1979941 RepID=A0A7R9PV15_9ACAR|nr:unnamed protein product [Medioppia subpectinata]CAG2101387.1 unnamed protein product [Medioppia subpectinata]
MDAKRLAEAEGKPGFECLIDNNIAAVVMDMYLAGTDTIYTTLVWNLLFMVYYSDWQQIMRNEVNDRLGDRAPVVTDKHHLHNVMAFVYETIRWRNAGPMGAPHMTLSDTILGGKYPVPGQTILIIHLWHILTNDKYFTNADQFKPERFIDEHGQFNSIESSAYIPFGTGRHGRAYLIVSVLENRTVLIYPVLWQRNVKTVREWGEENKEGLIPFG